MSLDFIPYPDLDDKDFYKKIYYKKEFYDTKPDPLPDPSNQSNETLYKLFQKDKDFKLQSAQMFLRNYISDTTPYKGILIFHGTGTGKTCASIVIAERFHERVNETGKKILIIANRTIQNEFYKTIFNFEKEASKKTRQVVQCTGKTYKLGEDSKYYSVKQKEAIITKMINNIYEIIGRDVLRNKLMSETGWDGNENNLNDNIKKIIKEIYSDRVIIIDEVHNRSTKADTEGKFPKLMETIIENANNVRLILMSATPMVNKPKDFIHNINLLRLNDRRPQIKTGIFNINGDFVEGGEKLFKEMCKGYISYVRGGDPPKFPYKIIPPEAVIPSPEYLFNNEKIPDNQKIKHTSVIECIMDKFQYDTYKISLESNLKLKGEKLSKGGILQGTFQAGNIIFPTLDEKWGTYGDGGFGDSKTIENALRKINSRDNESYQYAPFSEGFLLRENINKYSTKFAKIYDNIVNSVGIAFVYSRFLPGGVIPLALMLEENGFEPAIITGKEHERFSSKTKKPKICYMCGEVKHATKDHVWAPAKYVLLTGSQDLSKSDISKISGYINRDDNSAGKLVKVLLGSEVAGEGIDFKRIRQVHILEPWFNKAKLDQVEGRAIRNGSHMDLPPEQRNTDIFQYCIVPPSNKKREDKIETIDEMAYRIAEDKDKKIKKVEYILKEIAVDCLFQRDNNIRVINRNINLEDSRGNIIKYVTGDKPYSRECNYMKSCSYKCQWEPKELLNINKSTYGSDFADADIEKARNIIVDMYTNNPVIEINTIFSIIKQKYSTIEDIYIYLALESLMNKKGDYYLQDKYGRDGYLVEKGNLYIYQPFEIDDNKAPLIYKTTPLEKKPEDVPFTEENIEKKSDIEVNKIKSDDILNKRFQYYNNIKNILTKYIDNIEKYNNYLIDSTFYTLSDKITLELLKYITSPLYKKNKNKELESFKNIAFDYYIKNGNILINSKTNTLSIIVGTLCSQWGRSTFGVKKVLTKKWGKCDSDIEASMINNLNYLNYQKLWNKISEDKKYREDEKISRGNYLFILKQSDVRPSYVGTLESKDIGDEKYFKLLDFTKSKNESNKVSKRNDLRGMVCSSYHVNYLKKILIVLEKILLEKLNIKIHILHKKEPRQNICLKIEFILRLLNEYTDNVWFYQGYFEEEKTII
jgi:hypothetical protein